MKAQYQVMRVGDDEVLIEDTGHLTGRSVTNDADAVVARLYSEFGDRRFLYIDSSGDRDELLHDRGKFTGFGPARP